jgi:hypothetical protein
MSGQGEPLLKQCPSVILARLLCMVGGGATAVLVRSEPRVVTAKRVKLSPATTLIRLHYAADR